MRAVDPAAAFVQVRDEDFLHAQCFETDAGADDIRDGIQRADLVEVHVLGRHPVDLPFRHGDLLKHPERVLLHECGKVALLDQFTDFAVCPPMFMLVVMIMIVVMAATFVAMVVIMRVAVAVGVMV